MLMKKMKERMITSIITLQPAGVEILGDEDGVDGSRPTNRAAKSLREKSIRMMQAAVIDVGEEVEVDEEDEGAAIADAGEEAIEMRAEVINV